MPDLRNLLSGLLVRGGKEQVVPVRLAPAPPRGPYEAVYPGTPGAHGSPVDWPEPYAFDPNKFGTGELGLKHAGPRAEARDLGLHEGHGHYVTDATNPAGIATAVDYRARAPAGPEYIGPLEWIKRAAGNKQDAARSYLEYATARELPSETIQRQLDLIQNAPGGVYQTMLRMDKQHMLDLDKRLGEQSPFVQARTIAPAVQELQGKVGQRDLRDLPDWTGREVVQRMGDVAGQPAAADTLARWGLPASRTRNTFIVYPGREVDKPGLPGLMPVTGKLALGGAVAGGAAAMGSLAVSDEAQAAPPLGGRAFEAAQARAAKQGFTRDAYRGEGVPIVGTSFIERHPGRYDPGFLGADAIYSTNAPRLANDYSTFKAYREADPAPNVMPLKVRMDNPKIITGEDKARIAKMAEPERDAWLRDTYRSGHDGVLVKYPGGYEEYVAPAAQYRSRFAAFDPEHTNSSDLLKTIVPPMAAGTAMGSLAADRAEASAPPATQPMGSLAGPDGGSMEQYIAAAATPRESFASRFQPAPAAFEERFPRGFASTRTGPTTTAEQLKAGLSEGLQRHLQNFRSPQEQLTGYDEEARNEAADRLGAIAAQVPEPEGFGGYTTRRIGRMVGNPSSYMGVRPDVGVLGAVASGTTSAAAGYPFRGTAAEPVAEAIGSFGPMAVERVPGVVGSAAKAVPRRFGRAPAGDIDAMMGGLARQE